MRDTQLRDIICLENDFIYSSGNKVIAELLETKWRNYLDQKNIKQGMKTASTHMLDNLHMYLNGEIDHKLASIFMLSYTI